MAEKITSLGSHVKREQDNKVREKKIHINIGEVGEFAKIGQLHPNHAFNLDIATRRSARSIAHERLYGSGFPRVVLAAPPTEEMVASARRSCSARYTSGASAYSQSGYSSDIVASTIGTTDIAGPAGGGGAAASSSSGSGGATRLPALNQAANPNVGSGAISDLRKELAQHTGGGGFNLSLLSSSRYYHSSASTMSGQGEATRKSPRNQARKFIQQQTQLPYGREAFDGISDTGDSLYRADFCRRYGINDPSKYNSCVEVMKNSDRIVRDPSVGQPKFMTQTPRGEATMREIMTKRPRKEVAALAGGCF